MAQSAENPKRAFASRSEASRHAALVRWKKESPLGKSDPASIAARVKEILAEKAKKKQPKGKAKPKGGGGKGKAPKAKDARTSQEKRNQNRAAVAKQSGMEDLEGPLVRIGAGMSSDLEPEAYTKLIGKGLAKREVDGTTTLTPAGRKWKAAADKGDADGAQGALAEGRSAAAKDAAKEQGKAEKTQAREAKKQDAAKKQNERAARQKEAAQQRAKLKQASGKVKKEKAQAKEKAGAERAAAPAKRQAENRETVIKNMADQDAGLAPGGARAILDFADGKPLADDAATALEGMGLVERGEDGARRLTSAGRAATAAMSKGDTRGALDAISRAGDTKKAKKAMTDILEIKAGARHSKTDLQHIQSIHDSAVACGADCGMGEGDDGEDGEMDMAEKAVKAMQDDPQYYAQHECSDVGNACSALANLTMLIQSELMEGDGDDADVSQLVDACRMLLKYIEGELDKIEGAAADSAGTIGHEPMKAITEREDVNPKAGIAEYGAVAFADAKNKKYPIDTEAHVRAALNYFSKDENKAKYSADDQKTIMGKIVAAWKKLIDTAGPPSAGKAIDMIHIDGGAIKAIGDDEIGGYAVLFGSAQTPDLERDFYTKSTDFWIDHFGWPRPITYHHGLDPATRSDPVIGHWVKATVDDNGVFLSGQLDKAHRYYKAIKELAARGYLKLSSDSAPQWVLRERDAQTGTNFVKRWPLVTASCTVTPMEPRMLPVEVKAFLAELGLDAIDNDNPEAGDTTDRERADGLKADADRARRLAMELDLLELVEETAL